MCFMLCAVFLELKNIENQMCFYAFPIPHIIEYNVVILFIFVYNVVEYNVVILFIFVYNVVIYF